MRKQLGSDFKKKKPASILDIPDMKYFPGHNALYINYISGSRAHDNIFMVHGNGYLKGFKAAESQTPNLPSPPFPFLWSPRPGSSYSLTPLKAQTHPDTKTHHTKQVSPPSCLCVRVAPFSNDHGELYPESKDDGAALCPGQRWKYRT